MLYKSNVLIKTIVGRFEASLKVCFSLGQHGFPAFQFSLMTSDAKIKPANDVVKFQLSSVHYGFKLLKD